VKALVKYAAGDGNRRCPRCSGAHGRENLVRWKLGSAACVELIYHILHDTFRNYPPVILGHEFAGTVAEVGANVSSVAVGEKVAGLGATAVLAENVNIVFPGISYSARIGEAWDTV